MSHIFKNCSQLKQLQDEDRRILEEDAHTQRPTTMDMSPSGKKKARDKNRKKTDTPFGSSPEGDRLYGGSFQPLSKPAWNKENTTLNGRQLQLRKDFYQKFPGVAEDALDNILEVCGYNMSNATSMVQVKYLQYNLFIETSTLCPGPLLTMKICI